ncbi:ESCRT-III subunit protein snf7 [Coemansia sp. RSA 552]|nr:ESCRT-III subunit protein snf7 [Coemansia sp. RSA 552]
MQLFFGKKKETTPRDAIVKLRENAEMLEKRRKHIEAKIDNELRIARDNATRNKSKAMQALKRKKMYEGQLEQMNGAQMTLETQMTTIESANINSELMKSMQQGASAMQQIHKDLSIDKVDQTMDEIRDQMDVAKEVSDAISRPELFGADLDEDELNAELEELEQEELDSQLLHAANPGLSLPEAPKGSTMPARMQPLSPPARSNRPAADDEDAELDELRQAMEAA